ITVMLNDEDETFQNQITYMAGSGPSNIVAADIDNDAKPDLVVVNSGEQSVTIIWNLCP
ncbi:unnamed protein product, partial [Adineta steineri]